jgi:hypothetical protein
MTGSAFHFFRAAAVVAALCVAGCSQTAAPVEPATYSTQNPPDQATCAKLSKHTRTVLGCPQSRADKVAQGRAANDKVCALTGQLAELTMEARQTGVPLSTTLTATTSELGRELALGAYNTPAFYSAAGQRRAVQNFRNDAESACQSRLRF